MVEWHPGVWATQALGRVYTVQPSNSECFYLRMVHVVRGPISFTDLKTVNGVIGETYREACDRLGPLKSDARWDSAFAEAVASVTTPSQTSLRYFVNHMRCFQPASVVGQIPKGHERRHSPHSQITTSRFVT
jgi:hypothetical protein